VLEKRDSDAKNNKRAFSPEADYSNATLALVAGRVWHLHFPDQSSFLPEQINPDSFTTEAPSTQSSEHF
jgi:hypothetical protein